MDQRNNLLLGVLETLNQSGFEVSERCSIRPSCFDLFARRRLLLLLLKVLTNIDGLAPQQAGDIQRMARMLSASPILVGERTREAEMEAGVLYERYGVPAVNPETLEGILKEGYQPLVISSRRGLYVNVDGERLRRLREERGMSLGDVARGIGVSKKAVYNYEQGTARPSFDNALKMEEFFQETVAEPVDITRAWRSGQETAASPQGTGHPVMERLQEIGFQVEVIKKAPFDALTLESREVMFTKIVKENIRRVREKARVICSLSRTARTGAFMVSERPEGRDIAGVPVIGKKELEGFEEAEDLLARVLERMPWVGS
ncbi:MAG: transcriptional regulator [Euryarchaeota archaeon]|nr:transcriptional regulator [Euryarchaeota archaeon]